VSDAAKASANPVRASFRSPVVLVCFLMGIASLAGNLVWNCPTCGWDLDGVPWYEAILVAGVPVLVVPVAVLLLSVRALLLRTRRVALG
jgi:hypothetical protein